MNLEKILIKKAKNSNKWIVLPEAENCSRVLEAGLLAVKKKICKVIFLGGDNLKKYENENIKIINPKTSDKKELMINKLYAIRKEKGLTLIEAQKLINDYSYFTTMLVKMGFADGAVSGAITPSAKVFKPALQIIKAKKGIKTVSSSVLLFDGKKSYIFSDCALVQNPTSEQLCEIALASNESCEMFLLQKTKLAFLSYSTLGSGSGESVDKVKEAVKLLKNKKVKFDFDGELQADSALNKDVAMIKAPKSKIAGFCNTLIFPDLNSANMGYKLYREASGCKAIGPIMQGFAKPINDLSRGATVEEIYFQIAITVIQSKKGDK